MMPRKDLQMDEELQRKLASRFVLYRMIEEEEQIPALMEDNYVFLEDLISEHYDEYWIIKKGTEYYSPTRKGELIYHNFISRWWDFILTYDIFAGVDLLEGTFAEDEVDWDEADEAGQPVWEDLRVAVCIYKQRLAEKEGRKTDLNPFTIAFMSLLSEKRIGMGKCWQFDLVSSEFWQEVEEIGNTNLWPEDLGYIDDETGEEILGDNVIRDVIEQGIEETRRRWADAEDGDDDEYLNPPDSLKTRQDVIEEYEEEVTYYGWGYDPFYYDPYAVIGGGFLTAAFIGAVWLAF
ncbi:TPA: hypothetical protein EYM26_14420 [Candidatus Poribacteria bacterium]|nr:hypothetical protein [Candidatus Poribacteria bacterium]HIO47515.1 hypothetical protein [Candidatus Poribacteria bacterium]